MKIWLLENGEKTGPHESFDLRERVEAGDLDGSAQAWYEGASGWVRLDEVPMMAGLFEGTEASNLSGDEAQVILESVTEVMVPPKLYLVRRLFARWFDLTLYLSLIMVVFQSVDIIPRFGTNMWTNLYIGLGYVFLDAGMTHAWRSSPGKWILGIRVTDAMGHAIGLGGSVMRSLRVWVLGWGMWLIPEFALIISWFMAWRLKYFIWDFPKKYRVVCVPMDWRRVVGMVGAFFVVTAVLEVALSDRFKAELQERMKELQVR